MPTSGRFCRPIAGGVTGRISKKANLTCAPSPAIARGGESGPAITWGKPGESLLLEKIVQGEMPPRGWQKAGGRAGGDPAALDRSRPAGRNASSHRWANAAGGERKTSGRFKSSCGHRHPEVRNVDRVRTPIDRFLLERLEARGLCFSPDADRATLLRRVYLDVTGLPPTPDEATAFLRDDAPQAYERLVDRLLASPAFGERWGRHWLDVVGYVDTVGFDTDATNIIVSENKWRYRDYVIAAWNQDKPYDRFLARANRRRRAGRLAACRTLHAGNPRMPGGHRLSAHGSRRNSRAGKQHPAELLRRIARHAGDRWQQPIGSDAQLRPLPQPQVRSRLLRTIIIG